MSFPLPPLKYDIHSLSLSLDLRETKNHNQLDAVAWCMNPPFLCERFLKSGWGALACAVLAAAPANPSIRPKTDECRQSRNPQDRRQSMRQCLSPTESDPPMVTRPPNSYRVLANPRYKKLTAIERASPLSANPFQPQPIKTLVNSMSVPPSTAKNAANGIHRAHSMSSPNVPTLLMGTGPQHVGKGQSGLSDPDH